ncbi:SDR family oxidoreductase [Streptomyces sp. NPDC003758]|uniref:SDR family oxidoreductase n=1 Tax=Streptomyces cynarae TaxID=2981134 RepID=A0ABY6E0L0_9ACTN|nr:SDR family oxidoreductase [Streptomyces cynarae]UXY19478.1 SDR family oxidoreductase [Streptomyces cynarae]
MSQLTSNDDLKTLPPGTVALVTGANKGIGFQTARKLGSLGATVLVGARDRERGATAAAALGAEGIDAHALRLDVTDQDSVKAAADRIRQTFGKLDILVNNAGVLLDHGIPVVEVTVALLRDTYETNVFGAVAVTSAMVPLLRLSGRARIVNISSSLGSLGVNSAEPERLAPFQMLAYNSSKAALNALTLMYAQALKTDGIKVNAAEPGYVATDLNGHQGVGTAEEAAVTVTRLAVLGDDGPTATFQSETSHIPW